MFLNFSFRANIDDRNLKGFILWKRRTIYEPTLVSISIAPSLKTDRALLEYARDVSNIYVSVLPPVPNLLGTSNYCNNLSSIGTMYDPLMKQTKSPPAGNHLFL